jgi:hypothetical protein
MTKKLTIKKVALDFRKVYEIRDPYIIKFLYAAVRTHLRSSDPVWFIISAPPSSGKTELVNTLSKIFWMTPEGKREGMTKLSTITSHTFLSGMKKTGGEPTSLLERIRNGILLFKDFTTMMQENSEEQKVIMAQLREVYDGEIEKTFGTGETLKWKGKITVIAAATQKIHTMRQQYANMGERFLVYSLIMPDRIKAATKSMENQEGGNLQENRSQLQDLMLQYHQEFQAPSEKVKINKAFRDDLIEIADLATRARTEAERDWRSPTKEIVEIYDAEMPQRFAAQLQALALSLMEINYNETGNAELLEEDYELVKKVGFDSIPRTKRRALLELAKYDVIETSGLAVKIGIPTNSVRRWLEDVVALGLADREKGSGNKGDRWRLKESVKSVIQRFEKVESLGIELTEDTAEENLEPIDEALVAEAKEEEVQPQDLFKNEEGRN